jgi:hypothetical protein
MSPVLVNPYLSFGTAGPVDLSEPWGEVARQESLSSGKLNVSGLDLSGITALRLFINGVTVTTDDSTIKLTFIIAGSEITANYAWEHERFIGGSVNPTGSTSDSSIALTATAATHGVGNASTESFGAVVTIHAPTGTQHKKCFYRSWWLRPDGTGAEATVGGGQLANSGAITGFVVSGSSDLTGGNVIVLGVE